MKHNPQKKKGHPREINVMKSRLQGALHPTVFGHLCFNSKYSATAYSLDVSRLCSASLRYFRLFSDKCLISADTGLIRFRDGIPEFRIEPNIDSRAALITRVFSPGPVGINPISGFPVCLTISSSAVRSNKSLFRRKQI